MIVDTVLNNCRIVTQTDILNANIAINNGKIVQIARSAPMPNADTLIDIDGRIVIPGVIDPHVHFREPGQTYKETFESGSISAAHGGVTTVLDMPNNSPRIDNIISYLDKYEVANPSVVDYGLIFEITNENISKIAEVKPVAYKAYLDSDRIDYEHLNKALKKLQHQTVCVHAEDFSGIQAAIKKNPSRTPETHSKIRSPEIEKIKPWKKYWNAFVN